jgi:hypothetical protein
MKLKSFADVNARVTIEIGDGRTIQLDELIQSRTYAGLLIGIPREDMQDSILEYAMNKAREHLGEHPAPHLIEPAMVEFEVELTPRRVDRNLKVIPDDGEIRRIRGRRLPLTLCMARFSSAEPVDKGRDGRIFDESIANLLWFQEYFGPPCDPAVVMQFKSLPWSQIACDVSQ